jgi:hypothetical protein
MYQLIKPGDNVTNMITLFTSKLIHFLLLITQYSEAPNHKNEFKVLNLISKPTTGKLKTDNDIYKYYGITKNEQQLIEEVVSGSTTKKDKRKKHGIKSRSDYGLQDLFKSKDTLREGFDPGPDPGPKKTPKKRTCSKTHPPPDKGECPKDKPRIKNGCCYKTTKTQKKKGGVRRTRRFRQNKRSLRKRR